MWELDCEESWVPKNWCFWSVVLEKTLASPLDCKGIQPVYSKGDQFWVFFGRNDAKAETPVLWPPHVKSWLIGKDSDAGRDLGQEEKGTTEDEMIGWHHQLDGREFEWSLGVGDGQGGLVCCNSWGRNESDMTEQLNWTEDELFVLFSNLGLIMAQQTSIHVNCFMPRGWHTSCHPNSKMHIVGEGPDETPSALRCLSYLINSFLTGIKHLLKTSQGALFLSPSDVYVRSFSYIYYT